MKRTKKVLHIIGKNWKILCGFEIMYKLLSILIFTPLFLAAFNGIMHLTGFYYLTRENILAFIKNPMTITALLLLLICMAVYSMLDISGIIYILDQSWQDRKAGIGATILFACKNSLRIFLPGNILIAVVLLLLIPFLNMGAASGYMNTIKIPGFIMEQIEGNRYLYALFILIVLALGFLLLRWIYAFHYFSLEKCSFRLARKKSVILGKGKHIRDILSFVILQLVMYLIFLLFIIVGIGLAVKLSAFFAKLTLIRTVTTSIVWVFLGVLLLVYISLITPVCYACIGILFYERKEEKGEPIVHISQKEYQPSASANRKLKKAAVIVLIAAVAGCCIYSYGTATGDFNVNIENLRTTEVTAHRGASLQYPENTMSAFIGAKELGADWIELDVQQSRDGQIIVMHDTNFKRTTGVNKNIWEMDYEEIRELDAGSFFSKEFAGEKIPLLSEIIAYAKDENIRLNIELKPTGHETDFEKNVVDIIEENDFKDMCVITSQNYPVLERVKEYQPDVETVYVMTIAYGNVNKLTAADNFSVESMNVTKRLVSSVHNSGKQLYVWTVNSKASINKMIEMNVDNLITDNITLAKNCVFESMTSTTINEYIGLLTDHNKRMRFMDSIEKLFQ